MTDSFFDRLRAFAEDTPPVESLLIVGSHARGDARDDSDIDVVIVTPNKREPVDNPVFVNRFGSVREKQTEVWGACTSVRVWYDDGREVEFGLVEPSWAARPLDPGTSRVLSGGYKVIWDKKGHFMNLTLSRSD